MSWQITFVWSSDERFRKTWDKMPRVKEEELYLISGSTSSEQPGELIPCRNTYTSGLKGLSKQSGQHV
jgi:hypothetical protein